MSRMQKAGLSIAVAAGLVTMRALTGWASVSELFPGLAGLAILGCLGARGLFLLLNQDETPAASRFSPMLWCAALLATLWTWPNAAVPLRFPSATWLLITLSLWWGLLEARRVSAVGVSWYWPLTITAALVLGMMGVGRYLFIARDYVGDVDFFYYLCYARDIVHDVDSISDNRFFYFPGVYNFWCTAMRWSNEDLGSLQTTVIWLLVANAVAVALIVARATRQLGWGAFAGIWYVVVAVRFQGLTGVTEPLATLPWLLGILIWQGAPLTGKRGVLLAVLFSICIGLTVYVKQTGGLLALGVGWLLLHRLRSRQNRDELLPLLLLPIGAAVTLCAAVLLQGDGLQPLTYGADAVSGYTTSGNFLRNLYVQFMADPSLAIAGAVCVGTAARLLQTRQGNDQPHAVAGVMALAALATMYQFATRPYHHYMLLAVPCLCVAATVYLAHLLRIVSRSDVAKTAILLFIAPLLVISANSSDSVNLMALGATTSDSFATPWRERLDVAHDLRQLATILEKGDELYALPPRHNSIHFLLGTRSAAPSGYAFRFPSVDEIEWTRYKRVLLLRPQGMDETDQFAWPPDIDLQARKALAQNGFRPVRQLKTMVLYEKE